MAKKTKAAKPKKRKLSRSRPAIRARKQRAAKKAEAAKAERAKVARAARAKALRRRRREEKLSLEYGEAERLREEENAAALRSLGSELQLFVDILDDMRNGAPLRMSLSLTQPEIGARTPWLVVGKFELVREATYAELRTVFRQWRDDLILEAQIHPQRTSQIRVIYKDPSAKRGESESVVSSIGPWESVISELTQELNPEDEDSLASRYKETKVPLFYVYFAATLASQVQV